ncbi:Crocetin glucosyltransferase, chloroplastic [Vitis vinifera]|uniref:Crocetin glucosyltransferase, chloroplastic n=1 Tax=Vitis vinifera TaxID=29760 RepID=A0A438HC25_VITVI|nr:Crocetin glucosyltransferase, chloroplastic [Vitis vinifera]
MGSPHFLLVTFPAQGHINPALQFAKRIIRTGAQVSFATSVSAHRRMAKRSTPEGLNFVPFSDGYDDGFKPTDDVQHYMSEIKRREQLEALSQETSPKVLVNTFDALESEPLRASTRKWRRSERTRQAELQRRIGAERDDSIMVFSDRGFDTSIIGVFCITLRVEFNVRELGFRGSCRSISPVDSQGTNAKLIEDMWKIGIRVTVNEEGIVESDEFKRCLEIVMGGGEKGEEMRRNAEKWKNLAREAVKDGGSSDKNLKGLWMRLDMAATSPLVHETCLLFCWKDLQMIGPPSLLLLHLFFCLSGMFDSENVTSCYPHANLP